MGVPHPVARRRPTRGRCLPLGPRPRSGAALDGGYRPPAGRRLMGLAGILFGLALLIWLAFRGWTVLLLAPAAALLPAGLTGVSRLAHSTPTFLDSAAHF